MLSRVCSRGQGGRKAGGKESILPVMVRGEGARRGFSLHSCVFLFLLLSLFPFPSSYCYCFCRRQWWWVGCGEEGKTTSQGQTLPENQHQEPVQTWRLLYSLSFLLFSFLNSLSPSYSSPSLTLSLSFLLFSFRNSLSLSFLLSSFLNSLSASYSSPSLTLSLLLTLLLP